MYTSKPLFVTYMTDLGGTSLGKSYQNMLEEECNFFVFDLIKMLKISNKLFFYKAYINHIFDLRKAVKKTIKGGGKVIFQNLKPALFTYGIWDKTNSIIISDFSHTLYQWYREDGVFQKNKKYYAQKILYQKLYRLIALTDNLAENFNKAYGISHDKIFYVPLPLDFDYYYQEPKETPDIPRVLFVGGEFYRKGGNHLLAAWDSKLKGKCELILLTNDIVESKEGIIVHNKVSKGDLLHKELFQQADIFILPTNRDAYPIVLGEAAAASKAIITTKYALGARNIIKHQESGLIMESPETCVDGLLILLENIALIDQFKKETNQWVLKKFNAQKFKAAFLKAIK
jgi:glycosyltransferase involved in cell wall biosynthesis